MGVKRQRKETRVTIQRPAIPEPEDQEMFQEYLKDKAVLTYKHGCPCYACNANRAYFVEFWLPAKKREP